MGGDSKKLKCSLCGRHFNRLMKSGMYRDVDDKPIEYEYTGDGACKDCHNLAHPDQPTLHEIHERMKREQQKEK